MHHVGVRPDALRFEAFARFTTQLAVVNLNIWQSAMHENDWSLGKMSLRLKNSHLRPQHGSHEHGWSDSISITTAPGGGCGRKALKSAPMSRRGGPTLGLAFGGALALALG